MCLLVGAGIIMRYYGVCSSEYSDFDYDFYSLIIMQCAIMQCAKPYRDMVLQGFVVRVRIPLHEETGIWPYLEEVRSALSF